jgi:hypothetical protein
MGNSATNDLFAGERSSFDDVTPRTIERKDVKPFSSLAWDVDEPTYRQDSALSYSILTRYLKDGLHGLRELIAGKKLSTSALSFGSLLDSMMTDNDNLWELYYLTDVVMPSDNMKKACDNLLARGDIKHSWGIPSGRLLEAYNSVFNNNYKDETKVRIMKEDGIPYIEERLLAGSRMMITRSEHELAAACKQALLNDRHAGAVFKSPSVYYQLKFKVSLFDDDIYRWKESLVPGMEYRCMVDVIVVDHDNKVIKPYDLKTTREDEDEFDKAIVEYRYDVQALSYREVLQRVAAADEHYKDYRVDPFRFIVINKDREMPMIWRFPETVGKVLKSRNKEVPGVEWKELYKEVHALYTSANPFGSKEYDDNGEILFKG